MFLYLLIPGSNNTYTYIPGIYLKPSVGIYFVCVNAFVLNKFHIMRTVKNKKQMKNKRTVGVFS